MQRFLCDAYPGIVTENMSKIRTTNSKAYEKEFIIPKYKIVIYRG